MTYEVWAKTLDGPDPGALRVWGLEVVDGQAVVQQLRSDGVFDASGGSVRYELCDTLRWSPGAPRPEAVHNVEFTHAQESWLPAQPQELLLNPRLPVAITSHPYSGAGLTGPAERHTVDVLPAVLRSMQERIAKMLFARLVHTFPEILQRPVNRIRRGDDPVAAIANLVPLQCALDERTELVSRPHSLQLEGVADWLDVQFGVFGGGFEGGLPPRVSEMSVEEQLALCSKISEVCDRRDRFVEAGRAEISSHRQRLEHAA